MEHPDRNRPAAAFRRSAVAAVATAGRCFDQHIPHHLRDRGFRTPRTGAPPEGGDARGARQPVASPGCEVPARAGLGEHPIGTAPGLPDRLAARPAWPVYPPLAERVEDEGTPGHLPEQVR